MKKGISVIEVVITLAVLGITFVVILGILGAALGFRTPNNGEHTGYVTAVEKEGIIWRTDRAFFKTNTQSSQEDAYCVRSPAIVEQLKTKQEAGDRITILYGRSWFVWPWQCGNESSIIQGIK